MVLPDWERHCGLEVLAPTYILVDCLVQLKLPRQLKLTTQSSMICKVAWIISMVTRIGWVAKLNLQLNSFTKTPT